MKEVRSQSDESAVSDLSDESEIRRQSTTSLMSVNVKHNNLFIFKYKYLFLAITSFTLAGGFYNCLFQGFIKNQLLTSMNFSNSQYNLLVTIPHIPNLIIPIFVGPLIDTIGIRKITFIFTFLILIGMLLILLSIYPQSFALILIGKILHQVGTENLLVSQSTLITKWFRFSNIAFALGICSFTLKLASSLSGIAYPFLYEKENSLFLPFLVGLIVCAVSMICGLISVTMDKKSESYDAPQTLEENKAQLIKKTKFRFSDVKQFDSIFWILVGIVFLVWGIFFCFQNYGQGIIIKKFGFDKVEASSSLSLLFFMGMLSPLFGYLADRFGNRAQVIICLCLITLVALFLLLISPSEDHEIDIIKAIVYFFLISLGLSIGIGNAYVFPSIPLVIDSQYLGTAFGICYACKNAGTLFFSLFSGIIIGENDKHYNYYLFFIFIAQSLAVILSITCFLLDRKGKDYLGPPKVISYKQQAIETNIES